MRDWVEQKETLCVLVRYNSGEEVWEPWRDYATNPPRDSVLITDQRKIIQYYEKYT